MKCKKEIDVSSNQLILYECPATRSDRVKFLLEENAIPYEKKTLHFSNGENKAKEYLELNPLGTVPFLIDKENGVSLSESGAICNYLTRKFKKILYYPENDLKAIAQYDEMMYFATSTLDPICFQILFHSKWFPPEKRIPSLVEEGIKKFEFCACFLNRALEGNKYTLNNKISTPDFIIAPTLLCVKEEVKKHPLIQSYVQNLLSLPSMKKVRNDIKNLSK
jgi:glutathione S-transferase